MDVLAFEDLDMPMTEQMDLLDVRLYDSLLTNLSGHVSPAAPALEIGFGGTDLVEPTETLKDTTPEEREKLVEDHGFGAFRTFLDVGMDPDANEMACEMYRQHLATIIDDPKTAEGLMNATAAYIGRPVALAIA